MQSTEIIFSNPLKLFEYYQGEDSAKLMTSSSPLNDRSLKNIIFNIFSKENNSANGKEINYKNKVSVMEVN